MVPKGSPEMPERIIEAATRLFARRGFAATSLQAVADAVGIRKPSLLYHHPSKEALREAVLESLLAHWKDVVPRALLEATSGENRLVATVRVVVEFFREDPCRAQLIVREALDRPEELKRRLQDHLRPWLGLVIRYVEKGQERGEVHRDVDPAAFIIQTAWFTISLIAATDILHAVYPDEPSPADGLQKHLNELERLVRSGLFTGERPLKRPPTPEGE